MGRHVNQDTGKAVMRKKFKGKYCEGKILLYSYIQPHHNTQKKRLICMEHPLLQLLPILVPTYHPVDVLDVKLLRKNKNG